MTSRRDRRTVLAAGLLIAFAILTALPWRHYEAFDEQTLLPSAAHTTAWTNSIWSKAMALLGLIAGVGLLVAGPRRSPRPRPVWEWSAGVSTAR